MIIWGNNGNLWNLKRKINGEKWANLVGKAEKIIIVISLR